ncbi:hypothetical protein [Sporolactobacillus sp. KGMB 08714]|uniref:hypothetical protein n=1 Tax=Sporolactobacillus sp. KGMB 08714 TaxID=3064704 RepID=UPI002FBEFE77
MERHIPEDLLRDRNWAPMLLLFAEHPKLSSVFNTDYFDLNARLVEIDGLKDLSAQWSHGEKIMLALALHLYNESNPFNLSDLDYLDIKNRKLALEAIRTRFQGR